MEYPDIDYIAASFIRRASDVLAIKELLSEHQGIELKVIAKIENRGLENIDDIIRASWHHGSRGDLGVEIPTEDVPIIKRR